MIRVFSAAMVVAAAGFLLSSPPPAPAPKSPLVDVLTNRYDNWRSGDNSRETLLTPKNINGQQFGKLFERSVDGDIYAQPLVKNGVQIPGLGPRNVVYVATTNNNLYAFDADLPQVGDPYWQVGKDVLGDPVPRADVSDLKPPDQYLNFEHNIGVVATPVIDSGTNTIYIVAKSRYSGGYRHRLFAFDLATGHERKDLGSPVNIEPTAMGNGVGNVDGKIHMQSRKLVNRAALLLQDGILYVAFGAHADGEPRFDYHGWIVAYDAHTLRQVAALCTTPDGIQGGVWQSGAGLAAEPREGTFPLIYAVVGNGSAIGRNVGQSILQMYPGELLSAKQDFTPSNVGEMNDLDLDLSTGPVLFPDLPFMLACTKDGKCYVVDRTNMHLVQELEAAKNSVGTGRASNIHGTPVFWRDSNNALFIYVWGEEDFLRSYRFDGKRFVPAGRSQFPAPPNSMPGAALSISANGTASDSGVVWASLPIKDDANNATVPGVLRAFSTMDISHELWDSEQNAGRDRLGMFAKFCPPVVANGKVYMATFAPPADAPAGPGKLVVYGLLPAS
ncbi:MAG TPA: PQQ-binding-like beta-propeller repeat protein [Bryobacteraceae bacterium]|nr:PQQ-binding-like beta-propeller repeat protein [Bryobacteraceae bacterium]